MKSTLAPLVFVILASCIYDVDPDRGSLRYNDITSAVGPEGGTVKFKYDLDNSSQSSLPFLSIEVPSGAVESKTFFGLEVVTTALGENYQWNKDSSAIIYCCNFRTKLTPQNVVFKSPVKVNMTLPGSYELPSSNVKKFGYREPKSGEWKILSSNAGTSVKFSTTQLTEYGIFDSIPYPSGFRNYIWINAKPAFIEPVLEAKSPEFVATFGTKILDRDLKNGLKWVLNGFHSIKFLTLPTPNNQSVATRVYNVYNAYATSTPNADPTLVELRSNLKCTNAAFSFCDAAADYYGFSGKITFTKIVDPFYNLKISYVAYTNVVLKSRSTGKEVIISGTVNY